MSEFEISTDTARLDLTLIQRFLSTQSHWARGISLERVERSIRGSLCFGAYRKVQREPCEQVAFARVVTDSATFAYLCDVFVLSAWRGHGVARSLLDAVMDHPQLQGLRRMALVTRDAAGMYTRYGFTPVTRPSLWMERHNPHVYLQEQPS